MSGYTWWRSGGGDAAEELDALPDREIQVEDLHISDDSSDDDEVANPRADYNLLVEPRGKGRQRQAGRPFRKPEHSRLDRFFLVLLMLIGLALMVSSLAAMAQAGMLVAGSWVLGPSLTLWLATPLLGLSLPALIVLMILGVLIASACIAELRAPGFIAHFFWKEPSDTWPVFIGKTLLSVICFPILLPCAAFIVVTEPLWMWFKRKPASTPGDAPRSPAGVTDQKEIDPEGQQQQLKEAIKTKITVLAKKCGINMTPEGVSYEGHNFSIQSAMSHDQARMRKLAAAFEDKEKTCRLIYAQQKYTLVLYNLTMPKLDAAEMRLRELLKFPQNYHYYEDKQLWVTVWVGAESKGYRNIANGQELTVEQLREKGLFTREDLGMVDGNGEPIFVMLRPDDRPYSSEQDKKGEAADAHPAPQYSNDQLWKFREDESSYQNLGNPGLILTVAHIMLDLELKITIVSDYSDRDLRCVLLDGAGQPYTGVPQPAAGTTGQIMDRLGVGDSAPVPAGEGAQEDADEGIHGSPIAGTSLAVPVLPRSAVAEEQDEEEEEEDDEEDDVVASF